MKDEFHDQREMAVLYTRIGVILSSVNIVIYYLSMFGEKKRMKEVFLLILCNPCIVIKQLYHDLIELAASYFFILFFDASISSGFLIKVMNSFEVGKW